MILRPNNQTKLYNLNKYIKNSELKIYTEVGHLPMYEAPENTANDIKKFTKSRL